ncbi:sterol desaturase family protein [Phenylobacterium sp. LjRoot225]|uniref:sterol desaturase family protein n=1 Tax=Phenylobacterium sp. LjRoot225 TaxID=3342285 RepID=UPI003ECED43E
MALLDFIARIDPLTWWLAGLAVSGLIAGVLTGFLQARKIQPNGFRWRTFRSEVVIAIVNLSITVLVLATATNFLKQHGIITFHEGPASPWMMAFEFALYFLGFDTWFYWWHRLMHIEPFYSWSHRLHHRSISPNPLTTWSMNPIESIVEGAWLPLFTAVMTVHSSTMVFIAPFAAFMGLYVHSGFELFPRWWNKTWLTKWFITATFHDQHHRYFKGNYGGYTTIWDWICGTVRPTFLADYEKVTTRSTRRRAAVARPPMDA